jgi:heme-degrading monooxygenase HmoA
MFVNMATADPIPGKERELIERMKNFAEALTPMPGFVNVFVLREEGTRALAGLSIWEDKESFERAMEGASSLPPKTRLAKEPPKTRQFMEIR